MTSRGGVVALTGPGLREISYVELGEQFDDPVDDVLRTVVGVEGLDGEGEGGEEGNEVELGDSHDGAEVLGLGHLVDEVDDVDPLLFVPITEVDGIDVQVTRSAVRSGLSALADAHRGETGLPELSRPYR